MPVSTSRKVAVAALRMAISETREEEGELKAAFARQGIRAAAADFGGDFVTSVNKLIERAVVASKREGIIREVHAEEGAVAGATREAISQLMLKAMGLNVGGKIGIARAGDHVGVAIFFGIGLLHLDEVGIGLGHRAV
ncbi:MAG: HutP family protein [Clostridia bacterium]|nr:HutP family protein [Clostridia bacterium]